MPGPGPAVIRIVIRIVLGHEAGSRLRLERGYLYISSSYLDVWLSIWRRVLRGAALTLGGDQHESTTLLASAVRPEHFWRAR